MRASVYASVVVLSGLLASQLLAPGKAAAASGQEIYQKRCQACHGPDGRGNPTMAEMLKVEIQDLTGPSVVGKPEAELLKTVADGKGKMPPFQKVLTEQDRRAVLGFLKQLATGAR
jgi:mono/diheme cytochrome c family protein